MESDLQRILSALQEVESFIPSWQQKDESVSNWTVGQQIEHVLKATSAFTVMILRDRKADGSGIHKQLKGLLLQRGSFPRGIAKAPDISMPADATPATGLTARLHKTRNRVSKLPDVSASAVAHHHYLGEMDRDEAVAFMAIHLEHHIKIIRDIVNDSQ